jgi:uncharacterized protein YgbK (DUF1537 family)
MREQPILKADLLNTLPPEWPQDPVPEIQRRVRAQDRIVAVLDDDPTGTQTVHGLWVVARWTPVALRSVLARGPARSGAGQTFYILTNSRSLPEAEAAALNREIAHDLAAASKETDRPVDVVSRSDSTLRGHYPAEVDALRETLEPLLGYTYDGTIVYPYFAEGGRLTAHDIHWVTEPDAASGGERLVPAAQTEYARDVTFGYQHSNLRQWVEEKTGGRTGADQVVSISLDVIRRQGPRGVRRALAQVTGGQVAVVNAVTYRDVAVFVAGLLAAQDAGQRFLFRTAASFVKVRGGVSDRGLLTACEMIGPGASEAERHDGTGGLIVVGSYVDKTTRQLDRARRLSGLISLELSVPQVLDPCSREDQLRRLTQAANAALSSGQDALVYTSRERITERGRAGELDIGQEVSAALVDVVRGIRPTPRYVIAKGGITSSDVVTRGLGVQRAWVLGQILPGIPVWRLGTESRFPGLAYTVFPGNVGDDDSLATAIQILRGNSGDKVVSANPF